MKAAKQQQSDIKIIIFTSVLRPYTLGPAVALKGRMTWNDIFLDLILVEVMSADFY